MMFLFAIALVSVIAFSQQHPLPADYVQHYEAPLDPQTLFGPDTNTVTPASPPIHNVVVEPPVEPVVFALIMYSEPSAKEGAVLLKVYFPGSTVAPFLDDKAR
jgi:hypothetical protein